MKHWYNFIKVEMFDKKSKENFDRVLLTAFNKFKDNPDNHKTLKEYIKYKTRYGIGTEGEIVLRTIME